jgi:DNA primase
MSGSDIMINNDFLQELKSKNDIEDVISSYVSLKKKGSNSKGLCPFHNEKTPSFTVYNDTQSFYCFGCGIGGDVITFIKKIENLDYIDAVKLLAQRSGMQMPSENNNEFFRKRNRILEINRESARFFHDYLMSDNGKESLEFLLSKGITLNTIKKIGLGYAPDGWDILLKHLKSKGFGVGEMVDAGIVKKSKNNRYFDVFRNRFMIPIIDVKDNIVAFSGRVLDNSCPKYLNSGETIVYKKANEVFALNLAKSNKEKSLVLCEGYMDVISMYQAGITNAIASCGMVLTSEQVKLISRYADEVIIAFDNDSAGKNATEKAINLFRQTDIKIKVPKLIGGKDPNEIINNLGKNNFKTILSNVTNDIEYKLIELKKQYDLNLAQDKIEYINEAIKILSTANPIEQDLYLSHIADETEIEKSILKLQTEYLLKNNNPTSL